MVITDVNIGAMCVAADMRLVNVVARAFLTKNGRNIVPLINSTVDH